MKFLRPRLGVLLVLASLALGSFGPASAVILHGKKKQPRLSKKAPWKAQLQKDIDELEKRHPDKIHLYIKDLNSDEEYALHADENIYLASTVKVPIAIEVLQQVDAKKISLDDKVTITPEDYVDGSGPLKTMEVGTSVTIRFLIEQMIIWSDNMATDMLLRVAGLEKVNELIQRIVPEGFSPVTNLKDVRRHIYGEVHDKAFTLSGQDFLALRREPDFKDRYKKLASLLKVEKTQLKLKTIHDAYAAYYRKGLNSASPRNYARILEALWEGKLLSPASRKFLIDTMSKTQTGKNRIRAGLAGPLVFAHKTGTQYRRIGDVGYIWNPKKPHRKPIIVVSFVRDTKGPKTSEMILEKLAKSISKSGVL